MSINKELAKAAKAAGVCKEWHERLLCTETVEGLAALFFNGIDFCLSKGVPSLEYLRGIPRDVRNAVNIYVDEKDLNLGNGGRAAFYGETEAVAVYNGYHSALLYATGDTRLHVLATGNAVVTVDAFDRSRVTVEARDSARVTVFQYEGASVETITGENPGTVKVVVKHKKTY